MKVENCHIESEEFNNKLARLYSIENQDELSLSDQNFILTCGDDSDSEIRCRACELLAKFPSLKSEEFLLARLTDKDSLVRAEACDSISFSCSKSTLKELLRITNDKAVLVRGYAVLSAADVQRNLKESSTYTVQFLKNMELREKSRWVKIALCSALISLGCGEYQSKLIEFIDDKRYQNRCAALTRIRELISLGMLDDLPTVERALLARKEKESARSVLDSIDKTIKCIKLNTEI